MNKNTFGTTLAAAAAFLPAIAAAETLLDTIALVGKFINAAIPILIALAIIYFFVGLIGYVTKSIKDSISIMIGGIIAIFVMVSIWGIIALLQNTFKVGGGNAIVPQAVDISSGLR